MQRYNLLRKYLNLYLQLVSYSLRATMSYRLNFLVQLIYGPAYILIMFFLLNTAYTKAPQLGGWNKPEGILLFLVFQFLYVISLFLFVKTIRYFMWAGFSQGDLDLLMTKPVSTQFLATFSRPSIDQLALIIALAGLLSWQIIGLSAVITWLNLLAFSGMFILSLGITYLTISSYATMGFHMVRAAQVYELFDKTVDYAQYPVTIFPLSVRFMAFTFVPMAFFGYVPTLFLLGRGNWRWFALTVLVLGCSYLVNKQAWKYGLRKYQSASS